MKRWLSTFAVVAVFSAVVRADVSFTSVTTIEGGMGAMMNQMGAGSPTIVMRIKGMKARSDVEAMGKTISTVTDLAAKQIVILDAQEKSARVVGATVATPPPGTVPSVLPKVESTFTPTGQTRPIEGVSCAEYAFAMTIGLAEMTGAQMSPEAAEMMKDFKMQMRGSVWMAKDAPGAAEYRTFQQAASSANLSGILGNAIAGMSSNGLDRLMRGLSGADGIPYLSEITMTTEGSGPAADMLRQMGPMKITTKLSAISTEPIADALFAIPSDYTVIKP